MVTERFVDGVVRRILKVKDGDDDGRNTTFISNGISGRFTSGRVTVRRNRDSIQVTRSEKYVHVYTAHVD